MVLNTKNRHMHLACSDNGSDKCCVANRRSYKRWMFYFIAAALLILLVLRYRAGYDERRLPNTVAVDEDCHDADGYCDKLRNQKYQYVNTAQEQTRRKHQLKEACSRLNVPRTKHARIWANPDKSLAYCRINKCLSTFNIALLTQIFPGMTERANAFQWGNQTLIPAGIYKYMFVREPYGRFFSYYCNRFLAPKGKWEPMALEIIKKYRLNPSKTSLEYGHDLQFSELIQHVVDKSRKGSIRDKHMRGLHTGCNPCTMEYDLIGKLETSQTDIAYMMRQWYARNITDIEVNSDQINQVYSSLTYNIVEHFYNTSFVMRPDTSPIPLHKLFTRLWTYYQIHGHISTQIPLPFSANKVRHLSKTVFIEALKRATERSKTMAGVSEQTLDAMRQAYASVPMHLLQELRRRVVNIDCKLFGYNDAPDFVFDRSSRHKMKQQFDYFKTIRLY